jgi:pimeloyl-ACP methyl ester carboxylesterase
VLLGHSQGGAFAYRFSVHYPDQVAGVVTAGAPEFDAVNPARRTMPYVFTWGERDWLQEYLLPTAFALRNSGFNVRIYIVPKAEHEMTQFAVEKALALLVGE